MPNRKEIFALLLCLVIGFALRFYTIDRKSLWIDEIHTLNDSRDDFRAQMKFYGENPTYLHPPLFFMLTHVFYPFTKPERDLRIIPLIFGTLSVLMIYFLSRSFSPNIALPCTISLTFMTYHISLSQDGRSYSLLMFVGMTGLYFLMNYLKVQKKIYLFFVSLCFAILFYTSYSSIPFIIFSQTFWLYQTKEAHKKPELTSCFILNGVILILCLPWIFFIAFHYNGKGLLDPMSSQATGSFGNILYGIFNDWAPHAPLTIISLMLFMLFPFVSKNIKNVLILLTVCFAPIGGIYLFCHLFSIKHFFNSRYFINLLPCFLITIYLSLDSVEMRFKQLKRFFSLKHIFVVLFVVSNVIIFPLYYRSEKQDFRHLVAFLGDHLHDKDKIFVRSFAYIPGILHYFSLNPKSRHYHIPYRWDSSGKALEFRIPLISQNKAFTIYYSNTCCAQYITGESRLWIIVGKEAAQEIKKSSACVFKGYFDGSVSSFRIFPSDASMYLFLCDNQSHSEKELNLPIE
jgi:hypothetical protein